MAKHIVLWDDKTGELGSATAVSRSWIKNLFSAPFWDNIPDKPFSALGAEFEVDTSGKLEIKGIDASKITSGTLSADRIPALPRSKISDFFGKPFWSNIPDKPFSSLGDEFSVDSQGALHIASIDLSKVKATSLPDWTNQV